MFSYFLKQATQTPTDNVDSEFKLKHPFNIRQRKAAACRTKNPDLIPMVIENDYGSPTLPKNLHAMHGSSNFINLKSFILFSLREHAKKTNSRNPFSSEDTLIIRMGPRASYLPSNGEILNNLYENHKSEDGFLYLKYSFENTYG
jgi:GABA(A) receptor-associated protein